MILFIKNFLLFYYYYITIFYQNPKFINIYYHIKFINFNKLYKKSCNFNIIKILRYINKL